jgi:hypothetical protein
MLPTPPILERGLTPPEKAKFDRVRDRLIAVAAAAGQAIRVCEATGDGPHRLIVLGRGLMAPPLFTIPAARFLEVEEGALASEFDRMLRAG